MKQKQKTCEILLNHYKTYPCLQIQDIFKFLFQSVFGCEHFVSSSKAAKDMISAEYSNIQQKEVSEIEVLDGPWSRVPISYFNQGLSADTFAKLFVASSKKEKKALSDLKEKLEQAKSLVVKGLLPFTEKDFEKAVAEWEKNGFISVHHSDVFKEKYNPSYRVIANEYIPFLPLFCAIDNLPRNERTIIAVEGGSASGKTTLSKLLEEIYCCTVLHMDDFFLNPEHRIPEWHKDLGGNIDRKRFLSEVLEPISKGENIVYRRFDCSEASFTEKKIICPKDLVIAEGAYSLHPEFEKYYGFSVFLDIPEDLQRKRILRRNSPEAAQRFFSEWIPLENRYFIKTNIRKRCNFTIPITGEYFQDCNFVVD